ncbi:MAG: putative sugar O-methyltransferase [Methanomicrobiaceae archaeon]|nr:putative sugar O-methyltransferase [Methanomicrobiaceae archaeon]
MVNNEKGYGEYLFSKYYEKLEGPDSHASSHWSDYSSSFRVDFKEGETLALEGFGFGDMQERSLPNRWLARLCNFSYFIRDPHRKEKKELLRIGKELAVEMDGYFSFDCFRQVYSFDLIMKQLKNLNIGDNPRILIIGDGFGFLSCLIKKVIPGARIILVDLGKTLFFQYYYSGKVFPDAGLLGVSSNGEKLSVRDIEEKDFIFCPADLTDALEELEIDVAVNIHSMQEMTYDSISGYFTLLRKIMAENSFFYCCNREKKELVGGEVIEFDNYPWDKEDKILLDGYCPWCTYFFSTAKTKYGAKVMGIRIPFVNYFDGPIRHRVAILKKN